MKKTIFDYQDYKKYILDLILSRPKNGRGVRSELAAALSCQVTFISHVLNGSHEFNLEQVERINRFFGHSEDECDHFYLLVLHARAGNRDTQKYFQKKIDQQIAKRLLIKERLGNAPGLSEEDRVTYYSSWHYAAVHILLTIPEFQNKLASAARLGLSIKKRNEVIDFLLRTGLAEQEGDRIFPGKMHIHLGNDSPLIAQHHANWRVQAMRSLGELKGEDLHYSVVVSLSAQDASKIKAMLVSSIEQFYDVVRPSNEEKLTALCLDFFEV